MAPSMVRSTAIVEQLGKRLLSGSSQVDFWFRMVGRRRLKEVSLNNPQRTQLLFESTARQKEAVESSGRIQSDPVASTTKGETH